MKAGRLGLSGVAVALCVVVSLILSVFFCAFPWSMTAKAGDSTRVIVDDVKPAALWPQKQIDNINSYFVKAWKTGDASLFADCFASDGALFRANGQVVRGHDAIREQMKGTFSRYRMKEGTIRTTGLWLADDRAYETGKWAFTIGPIAEIEKAKPDSGYYLEIWRIEDGRWKMWRDIGVPRE